MGAITFDVRGTAALQRKFDGMKTKMQRRVMIDGIKKGAEKFRSRAADNVRPQSTRLADAMIVEEGKRSKNKISLVIGPDRAKVWWAVILEFGAAAHVITPKTPGGVLSDGSQFFGSSVNHPGVQANPWLHPAFQSEKSPALAAIRDEIRIMIAAASI